MTLQCRTSDLLGAEWTHLSKGDLSLKKLVSIYFNSSTVQTTVSKNRPVSVWTGYKSDFGWLSERGFMTPQKDCNLKEEYRNRAARSCGGEQGSERINVKWPELILDISPEQKTIAFKLALHEFSDL